MDASSPAPTAPRVVRARIVGARTAPAVSAPAVGLPLVGLDDLAEAVRGAWGADTAWIDDWDGANPPRGQCGSTALVVQDLRGGTLLRGTVEVGPGERVLHYWNVVDVGQLDLTWHQFPAGSAVLVAAPVVRGELLAGPWFAERYGLLATRVRTMLGMDAVAS